MDFVKTDFRCGGGRDHLGSSVSGFMFWIEIFLKASVKSLAIVS